MTTAEEKLDLVITEVKALQSSQLKLTSTVNSLDTWSDNADKFSARLSKEIKDPTLRMKALEATTSTALPQAPPREEEGRASSHRVDIHHQGDGVSDSPLHPGQG